MTLTITLTLIVLTVLLAGALVLVTLVQMLYMDSVRLRTKDLTFLDLFREVINERMGLKADVGILTFSLIKHSVLAVLGVLTLYLTAAGTLTWLVLLESLALTWLAMLVCAYLVPQLLYRRTKGKWMLGFVPVLKLFAIAMRPLLGVLGFLQSLAQLGEKDEVLAETPSQEENIDALIDAGAEEGIIEEEDRRLIHSVVAFGNKTVREVMTPRPDMVAIAADATLEDLRQLVIHEQFSRIPVYENSIDHIVGFVHVRDMFELDFIDRSSRTVRDLMRPIRLVPETKPVNDLLREMQSDGAHMAVVIDEYGSTAGLVTMEDMVEEIVGEIRDEHEPGADVERDSDGGYIVSGSFDVDNLQELLDFRASEHTESTTVGGLVTEWTGRVPEPGESIEREGIRIEVLASNDLRVDQVRISKTEQAPND
jgi:CBS domain containing-hemolysin-like protein